MTAAARRALSPSRFNMSMAVERLASLAAAATAAAPKPIGSERIGNLILSRICDWPEPSDAYGQAKEALRSYAEELSGIGGLDLMVRVFDQAVHRRGYRSVRGVSAAWTGVEGWAH